MYISNIIIHHNLQANHLIIFFSLFAIIEIPSIKKIGKSFIEL